jgi:hypothetical protein
LAERALLIRLRFCSHSLSNAYYSLKKAAAANRLPSACTNCPIPGIFPDLGKRMHSLIQYLQKAPGELGTKPRLIQPSPSLSSFGFFLDRAGSTTRPVCAQL